MLSDDASQKSHWASMLESGSPEQQVDALRKMSGHSGVKGFTLGIVQMAGSRDDDVRMWSSEVLESSIEPQRDEVGPLIQLMNTSDDGEICYWAATMLGRLGEHAAPAVSTLASCMSESMYLPARERATWALSQIGPQASDAIATLKEVSQTAPPRLQRMASEAIERILRDDEAAA